MEKQDPIFDEFAARSSISNFVKLIHVFLATTRNATNETVSHTRFAIRNEFFTIALAYVCTCTLSELDSLLLTPNTPTMLARHPCGVLPRYTGLFLNVLLATSAFAAVSVIIPSSNPSTDLTTVYSNFLGISLELSFINYYFGNDSNTLPGAVVQYLTALHERSSGMPVRLRLGGNSMDSSTYVPDQKDIVEFTDPNANSNDQPVNYGEQLFEVMNAMSDKVGGAEYLVGEFSVILWYIGWY